MSLPLEWPEPLVAVQSLSDSGITAIPDRYIKPPSQRPSAEAKQSSSIPVIDLGGLLAGPEQCRATMQAVSDACKEWGFFQVVNHGVGPDVIERMKKAWREFFGLPMEEKKKLENNPRTYEGYGNRDGTGKDAVLDWGDYYFLNFLPEYARNLDKWPTLPSSCREIIEEYGREVANLCDKLLEVLSTSLGLDNQYLKNAFGGDKCAASIRVNFYPRCPQPDLTFGLSPHSDPGGITALLVDEHVKGLQVCKDETWFTVDPAPNAFIINIADQIQVISNGTYESVEHRAIVNASQERLSVAFFYNPDNDMVIGPAKDLINPDRPAMYPDTKFRDYRTYVRSVGPSGKSLLKLLKKVD